jgi:uncharacterized membrane protein YecN with MAPEG domain
MSGLITGFYAALIGLLVVVLAARVVRLRRQYRIGIGDGGQPELARAIRSHGNLIENAPLLLLLLLIAELSQALTATWLHVAGGLIVAGRALHAVGLARSAGSSLGRSVGTALTWLALLGLALVLIARALIGGGPPASP